MKENEANSCFQGIFKDAYESMENDSRNDYIEGYKQFIRFYELLAHLKEENPAYKEAVETAIYWFFVDLNPASNFPAEHSHAHAKGILEGIGMFSFPEKHLKLYRKLLEKSNNYGE